MVSNLNLLESRRRILLNTPHIETISDTIASFETDVATKIKGCKVYFTPIQEGEGDPSPENVRPIHGWDGVTVTRCGKNILNLNNRKNNAYIDNSGTERSQSGFSYTLDYTPVVPGQSYAISWSKVQGNINLGLYYYDKNKNFIGRTSFLASSADRVFVPDSNAYFIRWQHYSVIPMSSVQMETGTAFTAYEPYTATSLTIPFNRTIYGGYVDLVKGEVVEEYHMITDWTPTRQGVNKYGYITYKGTGRCRSTDIVRLCNSISIYRAISIPNAKDRRIESTTLTSSTAYVSLPKDEDVTDIQHVYKIGTPSAYLIDPQTLKALRGMNNIWSDANGNVEVSFYTH